MAEEEHKISCSVFQKDRLKPAFQKEQHPINICFAANEAYAEPLAVTIFSLLINAKKGRVFDLVILTGELNEQSRELLLSQALDFPNVSVRIVSMKSYVSLIKTETTGYLTIETYFRLFLLSDIFSEYDKVLYLDSDILVLDDIGVLFDTDISGHKAGAVQAYMLQYFIANKQPICLDKRFFNAEHYCKEVVGLNSIHEYFNAGVLLLNLPELRKTVTLEQLLQKVQTKHFKYNDQDILNSFIKGDFIAFPVRYNYQNCYEDIRRSGKEKLKEALKDAFCENPAIIHYVSAKKPWMDEKVVLKEVYDSYLMKSKNRKKESSSAHAEIDFSLESKQEGL